MAEHCRRKFAEPSIRSWHAGGVRRPCLSCPDCPDIAGHLAALEDHEVAARRTNRDSARTRAAAPAVVIPFAAAATSIQRRLHCPSRSTAAASRRPSGDQLRTHVCPRRWSAGGAPVSTSITPACVELPSLISTASDARPATTRIADRRGAVGQPRAARRIERGHIQHAPSPGAPCREKAIRVIDRDRLNSASWPCVRRPDDGCSAAKSNTASRRRVATSIDQQPRRARRSSTGRRRAAVGRPVGLGFEPLVRRELQPDAAVDIHHPDVRRLAAPRRHVGDLRPIGRDRRAASCGGSCRSSAPCGGPAGEPSRADRLRPDLTAQRRDPRTRAVCHRPKSTARARQARRHGDDLARARAPSPSPHRRAAA